MPYTLSTAPLLSFLTVTPGQGIDASNQLIVSTVGTPNLTLETNGTQYILNTTGNLGQIANINTNGILCITDAQDTVATRIIANTGTITAVNPDGVAGNISLNVVPSSSLQWLQPYLNGAARGTGGNLLSPRPIFNFIPATGVGLAVVDNPGANRTDITISGTALGTISGITSTGGTVTPITNPNGPVTNLEVPNWSTVVATSSVQMNNQSIDYPMNILFEANVTGGGVNLTVGNINPTPPLIAGYLQITTDNVTGNIYDSYFNVPPPATFRSTLGVSTPIVESIYWIAQYPGVGGFPDLFIMPPTFSVGSSIRIIGNNPDGWIVELENNQYIHMGPYSTSNGGTLTGRSTQYDCVELVCVNANTDFVVTSSSGNLALA